MHQSPDEPSLRDRIVTHRELTNTRDIVGIAGEVAATAAGGLAGSGLASTIAGWFGANVTTVTAPALTAKLFSWVPAGLLKMAGVTLTTTVATPALWVVGSVVVCAGLGWGLSKLVRSGAIQDAVRKQLAREILKKIEHWYQQRQAQAHAPSGERDAHANQQLLEAIAATFHELGEKGEIRPDRVAVYVEQLRSGRLKIDTALTILREMGREMANPTIDPSQGDIDGQIHKATAARAFTALHKGVANDAEEPGEGYVDAMRTRFAIPRERALELYRDAPLDPNPRETAAQLADIFCADVINDAYQALNETAQSMAKGQAAFQRFLEIQQVLQGQLEHQLGEIKVAGDKARAAISRL